MFKVLLSSVVFEAIGAKHLRPVEDVETVNEKGVGADISSGAAGFSDDFKTYKPQL